MDKNLLDEELTNKVNSLSHEELLNLASEIRGFLIDSVSKTGGHIGANLGVVELTIALHYVFDIEKDKLLFDVGHQGYTHKLLTGRKALFPTLNSLGGMSRFISPQESKFDILDASHGGTAISIGTGLAYANKRDNKESLTISIVGDGAFVEGMSFEGLNYASEDRLPLIIVINDNGMSIPQNVGAVNSILKSEKSASNFFESMGYKYFFVKDGHDLEASIKTFEQAKASVKNETVVVHVKTQKGKGLDIAKDHPYKLHFSMPFDPTDNNSTSPVPTGRAYTQIVGDCLYSLMQNNSEVYAITPSTPYASGLDKLLIDFPKNTIDVGMAEQQAAGMAAGLALENKTVFLCYQSTFMQRAMDQIFHDICFMNLPITIISSRSGFAGFDSPTHHAIYDLSYLRALPNLDIFYASSSKDLEEIISLRAKKADKPMLILHPYEAIRKDEDKYFTDNNILNNEVLFNGKDGYIFTIGNRLETAILLRDKMKESGKDVGIVNNRWLNPIKEDELIPLIKSSEFVITLEENVKKAGFGSAISELITDNDLEVKLIRSAIESDYTQTGDKEYLSNLEKIDLGSIIMNLKERGII